MGSAGRQILMATRKDGYRQAAQAANHLLKTAQCRVHGSSGSLTGVFFLQNMQNTLQKVDVQMKLQ